MIKITSVFTDEKANLITVAFKTLENMATFKLTRHEAASLISRDAQTQHDTKLGELVSGVDVSNKPNFPNHYVFTFQLPAEKKQEKIVDKAEKKVTLKSRSRKPKTTGG